MASTSFFTHPQPYPFLGMTKVEESDFNEMFSSCSLLICMHPGINFAKLCKISFIKKVSGSCPNKVSLVLSVWTSLFYSKYFTYTFTNI